MDSEWDDDAMNAGEGLSSRLGGRPSARHRWIVRPVCFLLSLVFLPACSQLSLPAIDPSGSRIFLPGNTTQLELPRLHNGPGVLPSPAFTTPATPAPCVDGTGRSICNLFKRKNTLANRARSRKPGKAGEIQLTPALFVAPVGGEVTLLAGVCGKDGYLVTRQPLEWMLSPDSVGTFIDVGDDRPSKLSQLLYHRNPKVEKLDVDFARGRTSSKAEIITKGSADRAEHIPVAEGQTWLSISSPSEGVSRITALAPDSEIWDRRHQTATIYWVDAQWEFPPIPAPARAEQTVDLITHVTKSEGLVPAEGWLVKYTITDPTVAAFNTNPPSSSNEVIIPVTANGTATAVLRAGSAGRGTTQVLIDVIRPAVPKDHLPQLRLGGGQTMVTFSAPQLALQATGPEVAAPGQTLTYTAALGNAGDLDIEDSSLSLRIPEGWTLAAAPTPQPQTVTTSYLIWEQGTLAAGQQLDVQVELICGRAATYNVDFEARGATLQPQSKRLPIDVVESSVVASFTPRDGIAEAEVGRTIQYEIDVQNNGASAITNLVLLIQSAAGLPVAGAELNSVEKTLPLLSPGQRYRDVIDFEVRQTGQLDATMEIISGQRVLAKKSASIRGLAQRRRVPDITVEIEFPETVQVGGNATAIIKVGNTGETRLSDIQVEITADPSLVPSKVDNPNFSRFRHQPGEQRSVWSPQDLLPPVDANSGTPMHSLRLEFTCNAAIAAGAIQVRATSAENVEATALKTFAAAQAPTTAGPSPGTGQGSQPRTGTWNVAIHESGDPVSIGAEMRYYLTVENLQNQHDSNVVIRILLPQGLRNNVTVLRQGTQVPAQYSPTNRNVLELQPVNSVRRGERLEYTIVLTPNVAQTMVVEAAVTSDGVPTPVTARDSTTVTTPLR